MFEPMIQLTAHDHRRLQSLVDGYRTGASRDVSSLARLEERLDEAEVVMPAEIDGDVVTMRSEVRVTDLDTDESFHFSVVYPRHADSDARRISVLAPLGMAVLGRRVGESFSIETPAGSRRLRVDDVLSQPEREGDDLS